MNEGSRGSIRNTRRKAVSLEADDLVVIESLPLESMTLPQLRPAVNGLDLLTWAEAHRAKIDNLLWTQGAVLFRGFFPQAQFDLEALMQATSRPALEYVERSSPRNQVSGRIYTSTDYAPEESIFLHNELSYAASFPLCLFFACRHPAKEGGATTLADARKVLARIDPDIRKRFEQKQWMFVRNYGSSLGLPWPEAFQTDSRDEVEHYCRREDIQLEWLSDRRVRTRQVRPALARHPQNHQEVWFNHLTFFHISTLAPHLRDGILAEVAEADLPHNTYYGDGSPIEASVLESLRGAYLEESNKFVWQTGDILLLDNMLTSHGRQSFSGRRQIVVGMADRRRRQELDRPA